MTLTITSVIRYIFFNAECFCDTLLIIKKSHVNTCSANDMQQCERQEGICYHTFQRREITYK